MKGQVRKYNGNVIQVLKVNPVYVYTGLRDVNVDNIPPGFKTNFYGKVYEGGYLCEVRVKVKRDLGL